MFKKMRINKRQSVLEYFMIKPPKAKLDTILSHTHQPSPSSFRHTLRQYYPITMLSLLSLSQVFTAASFHISKSDCVERLFDASNELPSAENTITMCRWSSQCRAQGPVGEGHALISTVTSCRADLHTSGDPSRSFPARAAVAKAEH